MKIKYILIIFWIIFLLFIIYILIKNTNTFKQRMKINKAIHKYYIKSNESICYGNLYDHKESYEQTLYRLWDWGCENIVDKETYEKIKDYL